MIKLLLAVLLITLGCAIFVWNFGKVSEVFKNPTKYVVILLKVVFTLILASMSVFLLVELF